MSWNNAPKKPEKRFGSFLRPVYEPEEWRKTYSENPLLAGSVVKFAEIQDLEDCEAEGKLMDILLKATAVEKCLQLHGAQKASELFENLKRFAGEQPSPFSSLSELEEFLSSMDLLFWKHPRNGEFINTGVAFRRFVQRLVVNLSLGEKVHRTDVKELIDDYNVFIELEAKFIDEADLAFQKKELFLDFESLKGLARDVKGFHYDPETELLTLTDSAPTHLPLHLPILIKLVSFGSLDISRTVTGTCIVKYTTRGFMNGVVSSGPLTGIDFNFRKNYLHKTSGITLKTSVLPVTRYWFRAAIVPESSTPVEVFEVIPHLRGIEDYPIAASLKKLDKTPIAFESETQRLIEDRKNMFKVDPMFLFKESPPTSGAN